MKGRIFELEEQVKDINYLEEKNRELLEDNLNLVKVNNEAEYELHSIQEHYMRIVANLKEEITLLQDDNEERQNVNKTLYQENAILKSENKTLIDEINGHNDSIQEFLKQKHNLESTIHNLSKTLIELKEDNWKMLKHDTNIKSFSNKDLCLKRYEQWRGNDCCNDSLIEENVQLKKNVLLIMNQNHNLLNEVERIMRNKNDYTLLDKMIEDNRRIMIESLNQIERITMKNPDDNSKECYSSM